jgi:hypothetical protein
MSFVENLKNIPYMRRKKVADMKGKKRKDKVEI